MPSLLVQHQIESAVRGLLDDTAARFMKGVNDLAAMQGGETTIENYKLLGKRALIVVGVTVVTLQVVSSVVGLIASRKSEEQRIERVVRRVLEEEQLKADAEPV